jgi:hypothetical protein
MPYLLQSYSSPLTVFILPEMAGKWGNRLMQNEIEFLILEGMYIQQ